MHKYIIYGVKFRSKIKLGQIPISNFDGPPDVTILTDKVRRPRKGIKKTSYKPFTVCNNNFFFWEVENVAKYYVKGSDSITIDVHKKAERGDAFTFLMETILPIALIKNNVFVFHASAVKVKGKAYVICSGPGQGKSTNAAFLQKKGYQLIEDDKSLLVYDKKKDKVYIQNGLPYMELWLPQKPFLDNSKAKVLGVVRKNIGKLRFDISDVVPKRRTAVEKIILVLMDNFTDDSISKTEIKGIQKVGVVKNHSYHSNLIQLLGKSKEHFQYVAQICAKLDVVKVSKSRLTKLNDSTKFLEDEITC